MKNERDIHEEIEKTMQSLNGIDRAKTDDYFFARLQSRHELKKDGRTIQPALSWGIAAVIIIILLNLFSVFYYIESGYTSEEASQEELMAFAEEYALTVPTIYEQNGDE